jgi:cell shape-determining protein MreC
METQLAFTFGMLTVVAIIMIVVIVVGLVKVIKQEKQLKNLEQALSNFVDRVERSTALDDLFKEINHRIDSVENNFNSQLDSRLDKLESKLINNKK